ncbi:MAG: endonuclease V [Desulfurococcales archaeon]|nr:endonuclease V [Desulfurococcales archaeon]
MYPRKERRNILVPPNFSLKKARLAQKRIAEMVIEKDEIEFPIRYAVGVDVAFLEDLSIGAAAVVRYPDLSVVEKETVAVKTVFPYIPTLLAFREVLPAYMALRKIKTDYQLVFVDGNGRLHPYRAGFACHLGVIIKKPTIGIAKKLLVGRISEWKDIFAYIYLDDEIIGAALQTRKGCKPIFVSVGNMITLQTAIKLTLAFTKKGLKLPEPIRQAHLAANEYKRKLAS